MPEDVPAAPRWRRRKEARPREIVDAALTVFGERGFAATRLEDVAARAGVSKGTLYLYFPNKEELFKAVVREAILPNLDMAERLLAGALGPSFAVLETLLTLFATRILKSRAGAIPKLVIAEAGNFPDLARFYHDEVIRRAFALLAAVLERGMARGEFRPVDVDSTVRLIVAPMLMSALWRSSFEALEDRPLDVRRLVAAHLDALRRTLAPEGGPSS
ncbi:TetR/AcrR family transcriptional regulator [Azospirillum sp. YIM DDC1]|uniref:TetR/AcrR family transcriptional regulator n=1 Tax=Azospirillum aestuarii TaxID=2802052 RepID=A0ABS1HTN4_9PROT|nr:TetR/AcrR family transcriptional regulator [Azospirillum aestuarii]MBK3774749.1 TetR family transcriptional regulator [Azospirillum brasilense]MBK4718199.1 TetR/AcrR family transcriptional regulator [Azospirillum aestuarii]TWA94816.1 TetR family transcriptional regulator [Azospirillum brasilense]